MRLILALLLLGSLAHGQPHADDPDPDVELAARYFRTGAESYKQGDYGRALASFEMARRLKQIPALDYNIARCNDRLERYAEAIDAYERFLVASPDSADAEEVRARIATLRERLPVGLVERTENVAARPEPARPEAAVEPIPTPTPTPAASIESAPTPSVTAPPTPRVRPRSRTGPIVVGALAGAAVLVGAGLLGSISPAYDDLDQRWQKQQTSALQAAANRLETRAVIGYASLGVAGALIVVDVAWWVARALPRASALPSPFRWRPF